MSAKEHYRTAPIPLPHLPPEIWISIFRLATWSTDMFNPQLMVSKGCGILYREQFREFKRSLVSSTPFLWWDDISARFFKVTKRHLVRVCKAWYSLASPLLFEYVFLGKGRILASLRDGMLRSEQAVELQDSESPHAIGWRIQRLDVHMRDRIDNPGLIMDILADILRRLPNLRVLTFAITGHGYSDFYGNYLPENILQATNACRDTLRLFNWYGGLEPSSNTWASFLENHPRLEAINAPVALTQLENSHIVLDSLKSIYVHCQTNQDMLWKINLPSIHHAICDGTIYDSMTAPSPHDHFLQKIGSKLTSIQIDVLRYNSNDVAYISITRISSFCKNLARMDFVTLGWRMAGFLSLPATVHTLGVRINAHQISRRCLETFFSDIHYDLFRSPSVKTFCFTDERNVRALRAHSQALSSNLAAILVLGVIVMDHRGRPLVV